MSNFNYGRLQTTVILLGIVKRNTLCQVKYGGRPQNLYSAATGLPNQLVSDEGFVTTDANGNIDVYLPYMPDYPFDLHILNHDKTVAGVLSVKAAPPMASQSFLPYVTRDGRYLGMAAIPATSFTGNESTVTLGGTSVPVRQMYVSKPYPKAFLAIDVDNTQSRTSFPEGGPNMDQGFALRYSQTPNQVVLDMQPGTLIQFLQSAEVYAPTITPPVLSANNVNLNWSANAPFANVPGFAYLDLNMQVLSGAHASSFVPVQVSLPTNATTDPSGQNAIRAMTVQSGDVMNNGTPIVTTVRLIKVAPSAIATGAYVWPVQLTDAFGSQVTVNLTVNVTNT